jgi:uncharacterized protein YueI
MVNDNILKISSSLLKEINDFSQNISSDCLSKAYENYKNIIESYIVLRGELPKNHSILKNAKRIVSSFMPAMERYMKADTEVCVISESTVEKEEKKIEEDAKKDALKKIKEMKSELKSDYKILKEISEGINSSVSNMNFKLSRWHLNEMILTCQDMIAKINTLIGEEKTSI